ncbi:MAG: glycosyltransferase [Rheinheimera sp.]|nr:glycosyltransferase [Rheinheimera sp.]
MDEIQRQLHQQLASGERLAIGWGVSGYVDYQLRFSPYPFHYLVDGSGKLAGSELHGIPVITAQQLATLDPKRYVVVVLAEWARFGQEICLQAQALGFDAIAPAVASELAPAFPEQHFHALFDQLAADNPSGQRHAKVAVLYIQSLVKGGAERQMVLLAQGLTELGYQVHLVCQSPDHPATLGWQQQLQQNGVVRHQFPNPRKLWAEQPPTHEELKVLGDFAPYLRVRGLHNILCMQRILRQLQPELFVSYLDDGNLSSAVAGIWSGQPRILLSCRNTQPDAHWDRQHQDFYICPRSHLYHWYSVLYEVSRICVYHNSGSGAVSYKTWLQQENIVSRIVTNAVAPVTSSNGINIRSLFNLNDSCTIILGIMRLSPEKNPDGFINLIAALLKNDVSVVGVLLGDGPMRYELQQLIVKLDMQSSLIMPGYVDDTNPYLLQADLIVVPSHQEGMPNVVMEALATGCPIVCTRAGGAVQLMEQSLSEWLVDIDNSDQLLQTSLQALRNLACYRTDLVKIQANFLQQHGIKMLAANTISLNEAET